MENGLIEWLKKNSFLIALAGGVLLILSQLGFNVNVPSFYGSLDVESKIIFIFLVNTVVTVVLFVYLLNRTSRKK